MSKEILEDITDGDTVYQEGEEEHSLINPRSPEPLQAEDGSEEESQGQLNHGAGHVVKAQQHGVHILGLGEDLQVVVKTDNAFVLRVAHVVETELDHLPEGDVGEQDQQEQRDNREQENDQHFLPVDFLSAQIRLHGTDDTHGGCTSLVFG